MGKITPEARAKAKNEIALVCEQFTTLTHAGMWVAGDESRGVSFKRLRRSLLNAAEEFILACDWLRKQGKQDVMNEREDSRHLCQYCNPSFPGGKEVLDGAFIAAAIHLGFRVCAAGRFEPRSVWLNICILERRTRKC